MYDNNRISEYFLIPMQPLHGFVILFSLKFIASWLEGENNIFMKIILLWNFVIIPGAINRVIKTMCVIWNVCAYWMKLRACVHECGRNVPQNVNFNWYAVIECYLFFLFVWGYEGIKNLCDIFKICKGYIAFIWFKYIKAMIYFIWCA